MPREERNSMTAESGLIRKTTQGKIFHPMKTGKRKASESFQSRFNGYIDCKMSCNAGDVPVSFGTKLQGAASRFVVCL